MGWRAEHHKFMLRYTTNQWDKCRLTSISFNFSRIAVSFCWFLKNKSLMSISTMIDQRYNYFYQSGDLSTTSCYTQLHGPRQSADSKNCLLLVSKTDKTVLAPEQLTANTEVHQLWINAPINFERLQNSNSQQLWRLIKILFSHLFSTSLQQRWFCMGLKGLRRSHIQDCTVGNWPPSNTLWMTWVLILKII